MASQSMYSGYFGLSHLNEYLVPPTSHNYSEEVSYSIVSFVGKLETRGLTQRKLNKLQLISSEITKDNYAFGYWTIN